MSSNTSCLVRSLWCEETQECIDLKKLNPKARCDNGRTLVLLLTTKVGPKPTHDDIADVARQLVLKYPFMRDNIGNGYVS